MISTGHGVAGTTALNHAFLSNRKWCNIHIFITFLPFCVFSRGSSHVFSDTQTGSDVIKTGSDVIKMKK